VPTIRNQVLFVFLLLAHDRRRVLHFNVTANPTAGATGQRKLPIRPQGRSERSTLRCSRAMVGRARPSRRARVPTRGGSP
jgi:hypothetical protein